jgi:Rieske Fe-S protein
VGAETRRRFLSAATQALLGLAGAALAVPAVMFLVFPRGRRIVEGPADFVPVGRLDTFPLGGWRRAEVVARLRDAWSLSPAAPVGAVWVRRGSDGGLHVFSSVCPHLGCDVEWKGARFECPCHESAYSPDGARLSGPARRGLDRLEHRVREGVLEVKYRRFKTGASEPVPV